LRGVTVWQVFESVAARCADRIAVEVQRPAALETWTYRQLREAAVAHAEWLAAAGVTAGDRCGILADNDARWCAAYLGTLCLGAIVVPLDANYDVAQVATIVHDAGPRVLFVNQRLAPIASQAVAGLDVTVALLDEIPSASSEAMARHDTTADCTATILYTSGTTADPKGVVLTHGNLLAQRDAALAVINVSQEDRVLGVLPLCDALAQLANLLLPFSVGARVVFLETLTSAEIVRAFGERRITVLVCAPGSFCLIRQHVFGEAARDGWFTRIAFKVVLGLSSRFRSAGMNIGPYLFKRVHGLLGRQMRVLVTGGSKLDPAIERDFYALGFTILQVYGLTETSGPATIASPDDALLDTVGRAFEGHEIRILGSGDPALDGEIAIRGPIVMQGYYNRPEATRAAMQDGWFLTGDLGRIDGQGRLTITGRKKEVIVLASGKNIYPEEVEAQYQQSQFVKEICVMGLRSDDEPTTERLFAVVVPDMDLLRERRIANAGDLIRFELEGQSVYLPAHKRVRGYEVWFEPLPRTTTGKLKRHEIERRVAQRHREADLRRYAVPDETHWDGDAHALEAAEIIGRRANGLAVAPHSNLELDLALDSMERVALIAELEQHFGTAVDDERAPTILTVAQLIEEVRPADGRQGEPPAETSWAVLLRDLAPVTDPALAPLLRQRTLVPVLFLATLRVLRLVLPRLQHSGRQHLPASGPYIISPNHQSYLDPLFVCSVLPFGVLRQLFFVGATEYFETPFTAWLARQLNLVPVDPDANLVPAMRAAAFGLTHGRVLVLFPEGERSIDGTVKRFKKGAPILSRHLNVPIVPVAIHGVFELWPRNRSFNWRLLLPWSRHVIRIAFGPPILVAENTNDGDGVTALREQVKTMWEELNRSSQHRAKAECRDA
jgi:long-chain acyl-CoA synthetase